MYWSCKEECWPQSEENIEREKGKRSFGFSDQQYAKMLWHSYKKQFKC